VNNTDIFAERQGGEKNVNEILMFVKHPNGIKKINRILAIIFANS